MRFDTLQMFFCVFFQAEDVIREPDSHQKEKDCIRNTNGDQVTHKHRAQPKFEENLADQESGSAHAQQQKGHVKSDKKSFGEFSFEMFERDGFLPACNRTLM